MQMKTVRMFLALSAGLALLLGTALPAHAQAPAKKPNKPVRAPQIGPAKPF